MTWSSYDTWVVIVAALSAVPCALLGNYLVLRRMSMMGDAISHAVLPGIAIAFILTDSRGSVAMFIGAAAVGVLTALFTQWVHTFGRVDRGAAMGVVFTTLFAIGLILIQDAGRHVDLDPSCVLYGAVEMTPLKTVSLFGAHVPQAAVVLAIVTVLNLTFVLLLYKELKISSFDPELATTLGINAQLMQYLLMGMVAVTTVAAFESVGSILVIAMLIVPAATAHVLTDRLSAMIVISVVLGAASAAGGHVAANIVPKWFGFAGTSTAAGMGVVAGLFFVVAMLLGPRYGVVSQVVHRLRLSLRILREDVLGVLYRLEELQNKRETEQATGDMVAGATGGAATGVALRADVLREQLLASALTLRLATWRLKRKGLVDRSPTGLSLTDAGRAAARQLVRSHRLWESYLERNLGLPPDHLHEPAHRLEHMTELAEQIDTALERPETDPHGKAIPRED